jgi:protein gp37
MTTKIEWATDTINPLIGCSPVSPGCENCFAARMAERHKHMGTEGYADLTHGGKWTGNTRFVPEQMEKVLRWRKPRRIFWCSMGDMFHEGNTDEQIAACFGIMATTPQHTHLVLTKRSERALEWFGWTLRQPYRGHHKATDVCARACEALGIPFDPWAYVLVPWPLPNVWLGVTAEDQQRADERIPVLLEIPATKRFVSLEPLLSAIELAHDWDHGWMPFNRSGAYLDWVICGAETGPGKRPMDLAWARSILRQCRAANVPFFFKKDSDGNRELDGQRWEQLPC